MASFALRDTVQLVFFSKSKFKHFMLDHKMVNRKIQVCCVSALNNTYQIRLIH